ncbi:GNAT superfamily N-acetyltransferase [Arthrobacter stackebrandtii]|uniref:GNAT superfamily N-acetyltransferase n=1 Tax=Arthrobacter stackebrandtii TaxID=272161 RepID=A0ABS4YRF9_9MICC|nr:GNAT family N-acetyltransferase [Arthrobacter stackebrandtii]MBP2411376.1 GNAT superfamily N-acetyltransferase [Arthrobacter stackebrandtii]PYH00331.1 GNAT family N-acetyltransferase [Arthrobacter stackebrandtii]
MAELTYRPWRDGDDLTLLEIWGDADSAAAGQFRAALAPESDANPWRRTIVAEDQGIPVAAGVVYSTKLHPARLWAYVEVARDHRRAGVGATLLTMLRREADGALAAGLVSTTALRTKVAPGTSGAGFAEAMGLAVLQRNRVVEVGPGALKLPVFGSGTEEEATARVQDLATGSVELTDVVGRYYESVNRWDPTGPLTPGLVQRMFLDDLTGAHGALVLRAEPASAFGADVAPSKKGRIQAFALSYSQGSIESTEEVAAAASEVFLGVEPALERDEAVQAVYDLLALITHQYPVLLELDDSMEALSAVVNPMISVGAAKVSGTETLVLGE